MATSNKFTHLTLEERKIIETGIRNGSDKTSIATLLGKDKSTIGKEIKARRYVSYQCRMPLECANYARCKCHHICSVECPYYMPFKCRRRDVTPGACNGCSNYSHCRFTKITYDPARANSEYRTCLVESREGLNLNTQEANRIADIIRPLLRQGQSPYQIVKDHPELNICEKTLYNYITMKAFAVVGIGDLDLRRKVSRQLPKKIAKQYKERQDRSFLVGRTYQDYLGYVETNGTAGIVEMDTVYNDGSEGPFLQTFKFIEYGFIMALYHRTKTAADMVKGINLLEFILGPTLFSKYVRVLLTDRGGEFYNAKEMESHQDGSFRVKVFYCDPMRSGQKGSLENKHRELRYILPKETDLHALGLTNQTKLNLVLSHVNSVPLEALHGKTPWEMMYFLAPDLAESLKYYGVQEIEKDAVTLKPHLLK